MKSSTTFAISTAPQRNSFHWDQDEITWGEVLQWVKTPADEKEAGNYLFGRLRATTLKHYRKDARFCEGFHRRKDAVVSRSVIALDVDHPERGFIERLDVLFGGAALVHTTFSSTPDDPRYRMLVPTDREMAPDEYIVAARALMNLLGAEQFDPGTSQPERYMFKPAAQQREWFESWEIDGDAMSVDDLLEQAGGFQEDLRNKPMPEAGKRKRDPFQMEGVIGAFNRAYSDLQLLVTEYELPYEEVSEDRWHLIGARSVAGMGPVTDGIFFSHHVNDPAYDRACTAFDLVRLHKFGELDHNAKPQTPINRLPSHEAMLDLASLDARVTAELVGVDFDSDPDDTSTPDDWKLRLSLMPRSGKMRDEISNWDIIADNDPIFQSLHYNALNMSVETDIDLPWRKLEQGGSTFGATDRIALTHYLERQFRIRPGLAYINGLVDAKAVSSRWYNPVQEYLSELEWDGVERLETCLPGVDPTPYTRLVARKSLVAAVARMFEPGCKWDHTLVLYGTEGLGKSYWIDQMSKGYSASLGRIGDKDTLISMQRAWIMVSDEGHSLRKADSDEQKEFLTRREDVFRMPYERESKAHPRHCVIWGTTNDEVFLRRQEGNRRFLIVKCEERADFDKLRDSYIDQVWAEAVHLYRGGEVLFLDTEETVTAAAARESFIEEDAMAGVIDAYLSRLVPQDWDDMTPEGRRLWMLNERDGVVEPGKFPIMQTCSAQLWVEALDRHIGEHRRVDLLEISKSLRSLGWIAEPGRHRVSGYGPQVVFKRPTPEDLI